MAGGPLPPPGQAVKIVGSSQMNEIDRRSTDEFGIPPLILMENAGIRLWEKFLRDLGEHQFALPQGYGLSQRLQKPSLIFCAGPGNNGGDAMVMARQAWNQGFRRIKVVLARRPGGRGYGENAALHLNICRRLGIPLVAAEDLSEREGVFREGDVLFDGLVGTGLRGELRPPMKALVEEINGTGKPVAAIDIPSGLGETFQRGFPAVKAAATYTLGLPKLALFRPSARPFCGDVKVVSLGFPESLKVSPEFRGELAGWSEAKEGGALPPEEAFKNLRGHLGVFAGAAGTLGAALLAARAGGRSFAGLVTLHLDGPLYPSAAADGGGVMIRPWDPKERLDTSRFTALLVGPGWGMEGRAIPLARLLQGKVPGVLDADGLTLAAEKDFLPPAVPWVLTPHPGEMARLVGGSPAALMDDPLPACGELAASSGCAVVFKCHVVFIFAPDGRFRVVDGMNAALGTGGSGDVLGGLIAGFLSAGMDPFEAAWRGAALHQEAGRRLRREVGWFLAEDLLPRISQLAGEMRNRK